MAFDNDRGRNYSKHNIFVKILGYIEKIGYRYSDTIVGTMPNLKAHVDSILKEKRRFIVFHLELKMSQIIKLPMIVIYPTLYFQTTS